MIDSGRRMISLQRRIRMDLQHILEGKRIDYGSSLERLSANGAAFTNLAMASGDAQLHFASGLRYHLLCGSDYSGGGLIHIGFNG